MNYYTYTINFITLTVDKGSKEMNNQVFKIKGTKNYFVTVVNGNGYYAEINNSILGSTWTNEGENLGTSRIGWDFLIPAPVHDYFRIMAFFTK